MNKLNEISNAISTGERCIILHSNADLDCVGAAVALSLHFNIETIFAPGGVSHLGKNLLDAVNRTVESEIDELRFDSYIIVDSQDDSSVGFGFRCWEKAVVIDHHPKKLEMIASKHIIDEHRASTCELVWDVLGKPSNISKDIGLALLVGIISDTGHFKRGDSMTFNTVSEIMSASGVGMDLALGIFNIADDQDMSRRISRMKGIQRTRFDRTGDWIVAVTEIGAFESAVCHAILSTGADVAFAGSQKDDEFRITGRAARKAVDAGIDLGALMGKVAKECGGQGGGHDGAAGFTGKGESEAMLQICMQNAMSTLKGKKRMKTPNEENII